MFCLGKRSGILWGPFSTVLSPTAVLCIAKPLKAGGTMIFQVCLSLGQGHSPQESFEDTLLGDLLTNEVDVSDSSFAELSDVDSAGITIAHKNYTNTNDLMH